MWARRGRERPCPAGQEELPRACHAVPMPIHGIGEHRQCPKEGVAACPGLAAGLDAGLCTIPMPEWMKKAAGGCRLTPTSSSPHHLCPARTGQGRADTPGGLKWEITLWGGGCTPGELIREALLGEQSPLSLTCPLQPPAGDGGSARGLCPHCPTSPRTQPRHWHSPAGEAGTSHLLEMTLPGS